MNEMEIRWPKYIAISFITVALSYFFHELSHYVTGVVLGYPMTMTLNTAYSSVGMSLADASLMSAAGPLFTIVQALIAYWLLTKTGDIRLYPLLFSAFYSRLLASILSFFNWNDEARISAALGLGPAVLPVLVSLMLFLLVYRISKRYHYGAGLQVQTLVITIVVSSILILTDQTLHVRIFG